MKHRETFRLYPEMLDQETGRGGWEHSSYGNADKEPGKGHFLFDYQQISPVNKEAACCLLTGCMEPA